MALKMYYKQSDQFVEVSSGSNLTSPVITVHNGRTGGVITTQLYIRNDASTLWYSNVSILPVDLVDANPYGDVAYTETGWGVKLSVGSDEPTSGEWEDISWGNTIQMSDIGSNSTPDTTTYDPFWYLITCPPNTDAKVKTDIVLQVNYTENSVI